jgi:hypothetical protein
LGQLNYKYKQPTQRQMNIRKAQLAILTAIPLLISTFGFISLHGVNAANPVHQIAQASETPNQPPFRRRRPPRIDFAAAAAKLGVFNTYVYTVAQGGGGWRWGFLYWDEKDVDASVIGDDASFS